ncbi:excinuclease ABC subunit C [candidate division WOR-3 bacterium RBG_13_43_14]|uniref:UvrABC system protein C n=1 Tax=candidate division WOR-3 bacterium RBG_13_43_14 TaxID=1802590 RepID=A0A1F4UF51_UNCW3|nr:MAG: excinuclease ABC subunit C [candidate division WOR-3 bacterium RBG_13_43_14]
MFQKQIRDKILQAPNLPGVYLFRDNRNRAIYIGKALDLKKRLLSYMNRAESRSQIIVQAASDLEVIITGSDTEALTLEESLIKLNKPKFNVRLKDDKKFPYLKITIQERFPRLFFTRDLKPDGSLIFGPYTNARSLRQTRDAICRIFKIASCRKDLSKIYERPCLEHSMNRCCAPCAQLISPDDYNKLMNKVIAFLKGRSDEIEAELEKLMWMFADQEKFEAASTVRDQLIAIRRMSQRQIIVTNKSMDQDIIGIYQTAKRCAACLLRVRENRLVSKEIFDLTISSSTRKPEIISNFIRLIYTHVSFIPARIIVPVLPDDLDIQERWFVVKNLKVKINTAKTSDQKRLIGMAERNALNELSARMLRRSAPRVIMELQQALRMNNPPRWIEAFDVSNLKEKYAVGASVAFQNGKPIKQRYRRYRIKRVHGQNDFAMIKEIISRRIKDLIQEKELPDLLLIDGGKGQLSSALQAIADIKINIPVYASAKRSNMLFNPQGEVVSLSVNSREFFLLRRIQEEAHRFAITYHRNVRSKSLLKSDLAMIPGIGYKRRIVLLRYFGSLEEIKKASEETLTQVPGIGKRTAEIIYCSLHQ